MKHLEIHTFTTMNGCPCRDDNDTAKTIIFNGYERAKRSSQNVRYSCNKYINSIVPEEEIGVRTSKLSFLVSERLMDKYKISEEEATRISNRILEEMGLKKKKEKVDKKDEKEELVKTAYLILFANKAIDDIAYIASKNKDKFLSKKDIGEDLKNELEKVYNPCRSAVALLNGSMVANNPKYSGNACVSVAPSIGVNSSCPQSDFFVGNDTFKEDGEGSDFMGTSTFNSSTFYNFAVLNIDELIKKYKKSSGILDKLSSEDKEFLRYVINLFLESYIFSYSESKTSSYANYSVPEFVMIGYRKKGQPINMVEAFSEPVKDTCEDTHTQQAIKKLSDRYGKNREMYKIAKAKFDSAYYFTNQEVKIKGYEEVKECSSDQEAFDNVMKEFDDILKDE